jgi:integrase
MKLDDWPVEDRQLWQVACAPADLLDHSGGERSDRRRITNLKAEKGYGRWLTYLSCHALDCLAMSPADRITPQRVKDYIAHLQCLGNHSATILARLQELGEVAKVMGPERDWRLINAIASRIRARHVPARGKQHLKLSNELFELGRRLIEQAASQSGWREATLFRDGLLIAFLALVPLRRRNVAGLRLGRNLIELNGRWSIAIDADDIKTHAPLELELPDPLVSPLQTYLEMYRPLLAARRGRWYRDADGALWVSKDGSPMTEMAIYDAVRAHTQAAFGRAINPHLFRDAAATTLAISAPQQVRSAAPLLGHRTFSTTERHYIQAMGLEAHRRFVDVVHHRRKP